MPLKKWVNYIEENLFCDHAGFSELPYLSNNPQLMVDSILSLPLFRHNRAEQAIYTDNDFTAGEMRYRRIEEGLWLMATHFDVKKNIVCRAIYDETVISDHYFLSFAVFEYRFPANNEFTQFAPLLSTTCTFYKPNTAVDTYFYGGTRGKFYNIVFSKKWAKKNLLFISKQHENELQSFLHAETGFVSWLDIVPDAENISKLLWAKLETGKPGAVDKSFLKTPIRQIVADFFYATHKDRRILNYPQLNNPDYAGLARAESIILNNLMNPFIGVELISKAVNICPTKLKLMFKSVFGFSMLQYHKEKNMLLALQLIKNTTLQIKNIALLTGFESASKFTAAFKKRFNFLPSAFRNN